MIKISIDEAAAFDILSIFEVKNENRYIDNLNDKNYLKLQWEIENQIGSDKFNEILESEEYLALKFINRDIFHLIDYVKKHPKKIFFESADKLNYSRYKYKTLLQEKFFNKELNEVKIGYDDKDNSKV